jgi:beta-mannosidase
MTSDITELAGGWRVYKTLPNEIDEPSRLLNRRADFTDVQVPCTMVAILCSDNDPWRPPLDVTDFDWWFVLDFSAQETKTKQLHYLQFDGLATISEVWLNHELLFSGNNAFYRFQFDVSQAIRPANCLCICFRSQAFFLQQKHPRPRWKTSLVNQQNLRWLRTTVLGYVDSWTPPIKLTGPWRSIYYQHTSSVLLREWSINAQLINHQGLLAIQASLLHPDDRNFTLVLEVADQKFELACNEGHLSAQLNLGSVMAWMPHTHGIPKLYPYKLYCQFDDQPPFCLKEGNVGFKQVSFNHDTSQLLVNDLPVFCRGTCWSTTDFHRLSCDFDSMYKQLQLLRDAGVNMIRVGGTMIYENDAFYQICSELGILVWQDFMFASMDYPFDDPGFLANVEAEVLQQLARLGSHASLAVWCGNTDVEAQVAMLGLPIDWGRHSFYTEFLNNLCESHCPQAVYFASSPTGGVLPFHLSTGVAHYWGTGAYMHDYPDPDSDRVKFCSEGLGLSHIPETSLIEKSIGRSVLYPFSSEWLSRIPRDLGAGWDFDQIRDHYLEQYFKENAILLRRHQVERYMQLSTLVSGLVIADVFRRWRRPQSQNQGGLIWFNRDFWPCAGFGLLDSYGNPKAAYYLIRQSWKNRTVIFEPMGLDGLAIHLINESADPLDATLVIKTFTAVDHVSHQIERPISIEPHSNVSLSVEQLVGHFIDPCYAYRFGPNYYQAISAELMDGEHIIDSSVHYVTEPLLSEVEPASLNYRVLPQESGNLKLQLTSNAIVQYVKLSANDYLFSDQYFTLIPGSPKIVELTSKPSQKTSHKITLSAINLTQELRLSIDK